MTYPRTWWGDVNVSLHWPRAFCFYAFALIGSFLAPEVHYDRLAWALVAIFFYLQIGAYAVDLMRGNHIGQTHFSSYDLGKRAGFGFGVALAIGLYLAWSVSWVVIPLMVIGIVGILGYNYEVLGLHSRVVFGLVWGLYPVVSHNVLMTLAFPPPVVWIFGFSAVAFAELHITSYGLWGCRLPKKYCCVSEGRASCHGMLPETRRWLGFRVEESQIPELDQTGIRWLSQARRWKADDLNRIKSSVHYLAKRQSNLQVLFLGLVTLAVVVWRLVP